MFLAKSGYGYGMEEWLWWAQGDLAWWGGGGSISKNVENHVRENVGWILFKTHNFYIFHGYIIASSKCELGNYV
jgi:hypothetical protein